MKKILLVVAATLMIGVACKDKKQSVKPEAVKQEVTQTKPVEPDTIAKQVEVPEPEPPKPNKYFLIAGSFFNQANAESFKKELMNQGLDSEVITRNWGVNSEFFKVSYMGFSERQEAISRMQQERNQPGKEDVWVLVKR
jgi:cell division protein FtsN